MTQTSSFNWLQTLKAGAVMLSVPLLYACGGGGGSSSGGGGTPVADTTAPTISFSPASLTVDTGQSASSTLSFSDNVGVVGTPTVTCSAGGSFASNTYTAPSVSAQTTDTCTATARDAAGNSADATLTVTINPDTTPPTIEFSPETVTVISGGTVVSTLSFSDNIGVSGTPSVTCTAGSFANDTYTAPSVTAQTTATCTATAMDAAGNSNDAVLNITINPDTTAPTISFTPDTVTVASGSTVASTLSFSENVGVVGTPSVTCTAGSFANNTYTPPTVTAQTTATCTATATDAAGNSNDATLNVTINPAPAGVTITGKITYDSVPFNANNRGLNYGGLTQKPVRGATLEVLNASDTVIETTLTDASGDYSVTVDPNTDVRIRVKSEIVKTGSPSWDMKVTDNTNSNAVYAMQGSLTSSGSANSVRNLNADSGWGGSSYTGTRVAAPFAILDPIYETVQAFIGVDSDLAFPPVELRWSTLNRSENGSLEAGQIGTSSYRRAAGETTGNIYILGDANNDTDEYDSHVVVHEWGHYFEDQLSRSDSIGGPHSLGDRLDPRVAMGEGFANALSGIILGDPFYRDSSGAGQGNGFFINVEDNNYSNEGWYNEGSVQSIIYDIFDADNDGADSLALGLGPIYEAFTADNYRQTRFFTTIFHILNELKTQQAASSSAIDALSSAQSINGTGSDGSGETNNGSTPSSLPLYRPITVGGAAVSIESVVNNGTSNKLGINKYLTFDITTAGSYTFTMARTSGPASRDPDFLIYQNGTLRAVADSGAVDTETETVTLQPGNYVIDAYEWNNRNGSNTGASTFDFTITN